MDNVGYKYDGIDLVALPVTNPSSPIEVLQNSQEIVPPLYLPKAVINTEAIRPSASTMASGNKFDVLSYGKDDVFKELDAYLGIPDLGSAIETFKVCLLENDTPEQRLMALQRDLDHVSFISGSSNRNNRLYSIVRTAMIKYDINCTSNLPNGAPVWKKLVQVIWPHAFQEIVSSKEGSSSAVTNQVPPPPELPELKDDTEENDESKLINKLMEQFNNKLKLELKQHTDQIASNVVTLVENRLKSGVLDQQGSEQDDAMMSSGRIGQSSQRHRGSQDVRIYDSQTAEQRQQPQQHNIECNQQKDHAHVFHTVESTGHQLRSERVSKHQHKEDDAWTDDKCCEQQAQQAHEDPDFIITRRDSALDNFLKGNDAPTYKNVSDQELRRKQDAAKAISMAFKDSKFGGGQEEDWERHISDFETLAFDYQLRSKDLAYFLRLTLRDQALAVHRAEFPVRVKTYPKVCEVLKGRFDNSTKRETNSKALMRLDFNELLKEADGSTRKAFNLLVLKIEQLSAIATPDQQSDRAKIGTLTSTIEKFPWYVLASVGIESIPHFSGVVQKINHELAKISICSPSFGESIEGSGRDHAKVKRDILYALGLDQGESSSDDSEENDTAKTTDSDNDRENEKRIHYNGQRMYGKHPSKHRRFSDHRRRFDKHRGTSYNHEKVFDRRCFNCGKIKCQMATCPEPKDQGRIETNLREWRKLMRIKRPLREINLADIHSSAYTIHEAMTAEKFLQHVNKQDEQDTKFVDSSNPQSEEKSGFEPITDNDACIFFMSELSRPPGKAPEVSIDELCTVELGQEHKNTGTNKSCDVKFFDIPEGVSVLKSGDHYINSTDSRFVGYCLDSGAAKSVVGKHQYEALCKHVNFKL